MVQQFQQSKSILKSVSSVKRRNELSTSLVIKLAEVILFYLPYKQSKVIFELSWFFNCLNKNKVHTIVHLATKNSYKGHGYKIDSITITLVNRTTKITH